MITNLLNLLYLHQANEYQTSKIFAKLFSVSEKSYHNDLWNKWLFVSIRLLKWKKVMMATLALLRKNTKVEVFVLGLRTLKRDRVFMDNLVNRLMMKMKKMRKIWHKETVSISYNRKCLKGNWLLAKSQSVQKRIMKT